MSGNENDNKIIQSDREPLPAEGGDEFTNRPPHQRNRPVDGVKN